MHETLLNLFLLLLHLFLRLLFGNKILSRCVIHVLQVHLDLDVDIKITTVVVLL